MKRQHRTQTELAQLLGMTQGGVSKLLSGHSPLSVERLCQIAAWLQVDAGALVPSLVA